jgi:adhesin HecA-like repeat protein
MSIRKVVCGLLLVGLLLGFSAPYGSATPTLSIEPPSQEVGPGMSFSLDVRISGVADLFAYQFDLAFNPLILSAGSITEGPFLSSGGATAFIAGTIDNTAGTITATADTLIGAVPGVNGSGVIATVDFQALSPGESPITLSDAILLDSSLIEIDVNIADGGVTVAAVPEPPTWLLLSTGVFGIFTYIWANRCRKQGGLPISYSRFDPADDRHGNIDLYHLFGGFEPPRNPSSEG